MTSRKPMNCNRMHRASLIRLQDRSLSDGHVDHHLGHQVRVHVCASGAGI